MHFPQNYCGGSPAENLSGGSPLVDLSECLLGRSSGCCGARLGGGGLICSDTPGLRNDLISFLSLDIFVGEVVVAAVVEAVVVAEVEAVVVAEAVVEVLLLNGMGLNCEVFLLSIPEGVRIS